MQDILLKKMMCSRHLICIRIKELHDQNTLFNLGRILTIEFLDDYTQWWVDFLGHKLLNGVVAEKLEGHLQRSQAILEKCLVLRGLELLHFLDYLWNLHEDSLRLVFAAQDVILFFFCDGLHNLQSRSNDLDINLDILFYSFVALVLDVVAINTDEVLEEVSRDKME